MDYAALVEKLLKRDPRAAARLITLAENDIVSAEEIIKRIYKYTGKAYIMGISGPPGVGKSTFISSLTKILINQQQRVGIICIDPSSPITGGALLGDRIRMKDNFSSENVFIRSMANRGQLGGLARATDDTIKILDAYGCDIIIIETVGVGQSEVDIFRSAHTVLVLLVPGLGDDIQAIKAGIMEITDIFVINKMDLEGADKKMTEIAQMLELNAKFKYDSQNIASDIAKRKRWTPEIVKVNSISGENFEMMLEKVEKHKSFLKESGYLTEVERSKIRNDALKILKHKLSEKVEHLLDTNSEVEKYINSAVEKTLDPYTIANLIVKMLGFEK